MIVELYGVGMWRKGCLWTSLPLMGKDSNVLVFNDEVINLYALCCGADDIVRIFGSWVPLLLSNEGQDACKL